MDRDRGYHLPPIYGTIIIMQPRQNEAADVEEYFCPQANLLFSLIIQEFVTWFKSSLLLDRCEIY